MPSIQAIEAALAVAKTDNSKLLGVSVGDQKVSLGQYIPKAKTHVPAPVLSFTPTTGSGPYLVIGLDIDAPFPSFQVLGPILHWIQSGLTPGADGSLTSSEPFTANFIGASPPPGSGPHRYVFLLYEQPADWESLHKKHAPANGAPLPNMKRMRYDLDAFAKEARLGPVLAVNYFTSN